MGIRHNDLIVNQFIKNKSNEYDERKNNSDIIKTQAEIEELKKQRNSEIKDSIDKINEKFSGLISRKEKALLAKLKIKEGKS